MERSTPIRQTNAQRVKRSTPTGRLVPNGRSDQPRPSGGCPAEEAINSNCRTGVQRAKGLSLQPPDWTEDGELRQIRRFDPCCLRRTNVNSASAAFPRGQPGESESSSSRTRATGIAHPGFYGRKPWSKAKQCSHCRRSRRRKRGPARPPRRIAAKSFTKVACKAFAPRPGYRHNSRRLSVFRSSRFFSALRVSERAVLRQLVCPSRSKPRSGYVSGGRVMP